MISLLSLIFLFMRALELESASASAISPAACERILAGAEGNLFKYENRVRALLAQSGSTASLDSQQILEAQGLRVALEQQMNLVRSAATGVSEEQIETRISNLEERIRQAKVDVGGLLTRLPGNGGALSPWTVALAEALSDLQPLQNTTLQEMARGLLEDGLGSIEIWLGIHGLVKRRWRNWRCIFGKIVDPLR